MVILLISRNLARDARRTVASAGMALCKGAALIRIGGPIGDGVLIIGFRSSTEQFTHPKGINLLEPI